MVTTAGLVDEIDVGAPQPTTEVFAVDCKAKLTVNFSLLSSGVDPEQAALTESQMLLAGENSQVAVRPVPSAVLPDAFPPAA
jgi:hypothetical protein